MLTYKMQEIPSYCYPFPRATCQLPSVRAAQGQADRRADISVLAADFHAKRVSKHKHLSIYCEEKVLSDSSSKTRTKWGTLPSSSREHGALAA